MTRLVKSRLLFIAYLVTVLGAVLAQETPTSNVTTPSPIINATTTTTTTTTTTEASTSPTTTAQKTAACDCNLIGGSCDAENKCVCKTGFFGDTCAYVPCQNDTSQYSQCVNGACIHHINQTTDFKCECEPGYGSALCEIPICKDYCYNGGQCSDGLGVFNAQTNAYTNAKARLQCNCVDNQRFSGVRCEFDKCFKEIKEDKCGRNCTLDSSCHCLCGIECDAYHCNKQSGVCVEKDNQLACK